MSDSALVDHTTYLEQEVGEAEDVAKVDDPHAPARLGAHGDGREYEPEEDDGHGGLGGR